MNEGGFCFASGDDRKMNTEGLFFFVPSLATNFDVRIRQSQL